MIEPEPDPDDRLHDKVIRIQELQLMGLNRLKTIEENIETNRRNIMKMLWVVILSLSGTIMHLFGIANIWDLFRK